jgi:hypothetical protein
MTKNLLERSPAPDDENTIVEVLFTGSDGNIYNCVGVLLRESDKKIRVAFNAINDVVKDYLDIDKDDIVSVHFVESLIIKELKFTDLFNVG